MEEKKVISHKKKFYVGMSVTFLTVMALTYTHCGENPRLFVPSQAELQMLSQVPFDSNDQQTTVSGADQCDEPDCVKFCDSASPDFDPENPICLGDSDLPGTDGGFSQSCDYTDRDKERQEAIDVAIESKRVFQVLREFCEESNDKSHAEFYEDLSALDPEIMNAFKTTAEKECSKINKVLRIPVSYAISAGAPHDWVSHMAYSRSIIRKDHTGVSYIMGGDNCHTLTGCGAKADSPYYKVDHSDAREDYIKGRKKFFTTVPILEFVDRAEGNQNNGGIPAYPGFESYSSWSRYQMYGQSRLFKQVEDLDEPQIVPIYVADFRKGIISEDIPDVLRDVSQYRRSTEYTVSVSYTHLTLPTIYSV